MSTVLLILAFVLALIAAALGFQWPFDTAGDPHVLGWGFASFAAYLLSLLVPLIETRRAQ